jgi:hypothetical protein
MNKEKYFSKKRFFIIIVLGFSIYYLATRWIGFDQISSLISKANPIYIILAILLEFLAYIGTGLLLLSIFKHLGTKTLKFIDTFYLGTVTVVAYHTLPIAGFGEAAFNYYLLKKKKIPTGNILAMLLTRLIFSYSALFLVLGVSLAAMPAFDDVSVTGKITSLLIFILFIFGIIFARNLYLNFERFRIFFGKIIKFLDHFKKLILKRDKLNKDQRQAVIRDIHDGFSPLDSPKLYLKNTLIGAIYWLGDMACLLLVIYSLGGYINPLKLIIAYGIAITVSAITFIPGGLGILEGSLGLMLVNFGVPLEITVLAVIGYRLISFWLLIPLGIYSGLKLSNNNS